MTYRQRDPWRGAQAQRDTRSGPLDRRDTGADTSEILKQDLQLSNAEIDALIEAGVVASGNATNINDEH